jgi:predicted PurR-regulated permease PerM
MDPFRIREPHQLLVLICAMYITCIVVFWPLMTVGIWSAAIAVALMPFHKQLSSRVKPSVSVIFITVWFLLIILLVLSVPANIMYRSIDRIGTMVASLVHGFNYTGMSAFLPTFTEKQFSPMPDTLIRLLLLTLLSLTSNVMPHVSRSLSSFSHSRCSCITGNRWRTP